MKKLSYFTSLIFFVISLSFFACDIGTKQNPDPAPVVPENPADTPTDAPETPDNPETPNPVAPSEFTDVSSVDFAKLMTIGWNLGNTLDADSETAWGAPKTTKAMIDAVAAAGFKTIRIPVSWSKHVSSTDYKIDATWMSRVKEVVDYAVANDMFIILNVHHDNYSETSFKNKSGFCVSTNSDYQTKSKAYLKAVWTQIATEFASYNDKLIFELLNEPRAVGTDWEWYFSSANSSKLNSLCNVITDYEKVCVDAIRTVSGNENRFLMVPGYAASGSDSNMLSAYTIPNNDSAKDKLILSVHAYSPYNFAMANSDSTFGSDDANSLTSIFDYLKKNYTDKGIGVVMGEASASNKGNDAERIKWVKDYYLKAKNAGIPVVLWDNMVYSEDGHEGASKNEFNGEHHGWLDRKSGTWYFPTIIEEMMKTVGVNDYSIPAFEAATPETLGWKGTATTNIVTNASTLDWGTDNNILKKENFSNAKAGSILKIVFEQSGAAFKIINSSWNIYCEGNMLNGVAGLDPGDGYGVITTSAAEFYYVLTESDAAAFKSQNIYLAGMNGTVKAVYFQD